MESLLCSPARLANNTAIEFLKAHLAAHGALGSRRLLRPLPLSELEKFQLVPLVFALMPRGAYVDRRVDKPIKPLIVAHLANLGVASDSVLVDVLKSVCDQFWETRKDRYGRPLKMKYGMRDLRANGRVYNALLLAQGRRCTCCGVDLRRVDETLDHIVPWRLVGDVPDASNWQIMCGPCNNAKKDYLSSLQTLCAHNWVYSSPIPPLDVPSQETRFVVLSQAGRCSISACSVTPRTGELQLKKRRETGLAVADNFVVRCSAHIGLPT